MRTTSDSASVRLYHLDDEGGTAATLMYGSLAEAIAVAEQQSAELQAGLFLQTDNDVIAYLDFIGD